MCKSKPKLHPTSTLASFCSFGVIVLIGEDNLQLFWACNAPRDKTFANQTSRNLQTKPLAGATAELATKHLIQISQCNAMYLEHMYTMYWYDLICTACMSVAYCIIMSCHVMCLCSVYFCITSVAASSQIWVGGMWYLRPTEGAAAWFAEPPVAKKARPEVAFHTHPADSSPEKSKVSSTLESASLVFQAFVYF